MRIVIWGAGTRGKRIFSRLQPGEVLAFIDNDPDKIGTDYQGTAIIDLEQYIENFSEYFILVSLLKPEEVICQLNKRGIYKYFDSRNCPFELWGSGNHANIDTYLPSIKHGKVYGVFGSDFYSILCCERIRDKGEKVFWIPEDKCCDSKKKLITSTFDFVDIISVKECKRAVNHIFVTTGVAKDIYELKNEIDCGIEIEDIFDFTRKIASYMNPDIAQFKNIHSGKRCFIVATGPSLTMRDLDTLYQNGEFSIGMNRIYLAFGQTEWRPDYYMVSDQLCIQEDEEVIKSLPIPYKFVSDMYPDFWKTENGEGLYRFHCCGAYVADEVPPFSDDLVYGVYSRATVTYECLQLAVYLGFHEIYLIGVDFSSTADYKDKSNHFTPTYYKENSRTFSFMAKESLEAYEAAREYADTHGIKIYNATRGGKLEVFERVDFDTLF